MKMNIALKETSETKYWLRLLAATEYVTEEKQRPILSDCVELERLLTAIVKTTSEKV